MAASPVVTSRQRAAVVRGVPTEVVCTAFSNAVLVVATQYGKMGTLVYLDPGRAGGGLSRPALATRVLLGQDEVKTRAPAPGRPGSWVLVAHGAAECPSSMFVPKTWWRLCLKKLGTNLFFSPWL
ncbi:proteasome assembly chaperone 3 isoform X2 [Dromaius novaehollandiae]|uniref:proteasome assembly chaperone 3 isoform X2 n=1 Tax=Dromaius novaehollandiae TaxID=8790 RepID=UPI0031201901